jgi:4-alpha-glucanotransferase
MNCKQSGILLHISSLPSYYGIGDMGPSSYSFAEFLNQSGQHHWQVLPLNPALNVYGNSPYSSYSAFAGNPLLISPELLCEDGLLSKTDLEVGRKNDGDRVNYGSVWRCKTHILDKAYDNFASAKSKSKEYEQFIAENEYWIDDYSLFVALKEYFNGTGWNGFPKGLISRNKNDIESFRLKLYKKIDKELFIQFIFFKQWQMLKIYCNQLGIRLIGDLPIYINHDSSDVWSNPEYFKLDEDKDPKVVSGVPPDYFSKTGQLWGSPVYDWEYLKSSGYKWLINRITHNLKLFDIVRLDHFRGYVAYWEIPATEKSAVNGKWVKAPAEDFFTLLLDRFSSENFIAEDLGIITQEVIDIRDKFNFPGMKVLQFAFGDDYPNGSYLPHNHIKNCVVYTGTHDNNTTMGWWNKECSTIQKQRVIDYLKSDLSEGINWQFIELAMGSVANTVIIPMQDLLGLGENARMNTPSKSGGNWQWKVTDDKIYGCTAKKLREVTEKYGRT